MKVYVYKPVGGGNIAGQIAEGLMGMGHQVWHDIPVDPKVLQGFDMAVLVISDSGEVQILPDVPYVLVDVSSTPDINRVQASRATYYLKSNDFSPEFDGIDKLPDWWIDGTPEMKVNYLIGYIS